MQQYTDIYLLQSHSTCFGCHSPIIRSTKNCNRSLRYRSHCEIQFIPVNPCILQYDLYWRLRLQFVVLLMMGAVTTETCSVTLQ